MCKEQYFEAKRNYEDRNLTRGDNIVTWQHQAINRMKYTNWHLGK